MWWQNGWQEHALRRVSCGRRSAVTSLQQAAPRAALVHMLCAPFSASPRRPHHTYTLRPQGGSGGSGAAQAGPTQQQQDAAAADPVLEALLRSARSKRVRRAFFAHRREEYTEARDVTLLCGTYNVAGRRPPEGQRLDEWLHAWRDSWPEVCGAGAVFRGDQKGGQHG